MKRSSIFILLLIFLVNIADSISISIIPNPTVVEEISYCYHYLDASSTINYEKGLEDIAQILATTLSASTGFDIPIISLTSNSRSIVLKYKDDLTDEESYQVLVNPGLILVEGKTAKGVFYGVQTLLQLFPPAILSSQPRDPATLGCSCASVLDTPRFKWRGSHLDVARHFMPKSFILKWIDLISLLKLNVLHLHLSDDQGWRIEIKKYPNLTEIGAWRKETQMGNNKSPKGDGKPHGGYYTQTDLKEIVEYARKRFITVVPEIDMPGHTTAAIAAYPEIGCSSEKVEVATTWGIHYHILDPKNSTISFIEDVLTEVLEIFPSKYIHIGGDEADKTMWIMNQNIHQLMFQLGIMDFQSLQRYFVRRIGSFLKSKGRILVGWDEILEGEEHTSLPESVIMAWRNFELGIRSVQLRFPTVMAPCHNTYLDWYQVNDHANEPLAIGNVVTLEKVYQFEPAPSYLNEKERSFVLGTQGQLWSEYMPTTSQVEYMAFPRLCAISEVAWSNINQREYYNFLQRLKLFLKRLDVLQVNYRPL